MKRLEKMIPYAIDTVDGLLVKHDGKIPETYDNLISSFGVNIRMVGLHFAVASLAASLEDEKKDNYPLMRALLRILLNNKDLFCTHEDSLFLYVLMNQSNPLLKDEIMDAASALKLALRAFIIPDTVENNLNNETDEN